MLPSLRQLVHVFSRPGLDRHRKSLTIQTMCPSHRGIVTLITAYSICRIQIGIHESSSDADSLAKPEVVRSRMTSHEHHSGVTSRRQPRQCRGAQEPKTVMGGQSDPNYVSRLGLGPVVNVCRGAQKL